MQSVWLVVVIPDIHERYEKNHEKQITDGWNNANCLWCNRLPHFRHVFAKQPPLDKHWSHTRDQHTREEVPKYREADCSFKRLELVIMEDQKCREHKPKCLSERHHKVIWVPDDSMHKFWCKKFNTMNSLVCDITGVLISCYMHWVRVSIFFFLYLYGPHFSRFASMKNSGTAHPAEIFFYSQCWF